MDRGINAKKPDALSPADICRGRASGGTVFDSGLYFRKLAENPGVLTQTPTLTVSLAAAGSLPSVGQGYSKGGGLLGARRGPAVSIGGVGGVAMDREKLPLRDQERGARKRLADWTTGTVTAAPAGDARIASTAPAAASLPAAPVPGRPPRPPFQDVASSEAAPTSAVADAAFSLSGTGSASPKGLDGKRRPSALSGLAPGASLITDTASSQQQLGLFGSRTALLAGSSTAPSFVAPAPAGSIVPADFFTVGGRPAPPTPGTDTYIAKSEQDEQQSALAGGRGGDRAGGGERGEMARAREREDAARQAREEGLRDKREREKEARRQSLAQTESNKQRESALLLSEMQRKTLWQAKTRLLSSLLHSLDRRSSLLAKNQFQQRSRGLLLASLGQWRQATQAVLQRAALVHRCTLRRLLALWADRLRAQRDKRALFLSTLSTPSTFSALAALSTRSSDGGIYRRSSAPQTLPPRPTVTLTLQERGLSTATTYDPERSRILDAIIAKARHAKNRLRTLTLSEIKYYLRSGAGAGAGAGGGHLNPHATVHASALAPASQWSPLPAVAPGLLAAFSDGDLGAGAGEGELWRGSLLFKVAVITGLDTSYGAMPARSAALNPNPNPNPNPDPVDAALRIRGGLGCALWIDDFDYTLGAAGSSSSSASAEKAFLDYMANMIRVSLAPGGQGNPNPNPNPGGQAGAGAGYHRTLWAGLQSFTLPSPTPAPTSASAPTPNPTLTFTRPTKVFVYDAPTVSVAGVGLGLGPTGGLQRRVASGAATIAPPMSGIFSPTGAVTSLTQGTQAVLLVLPSPSPATAAPATATRGLSPAPGPTTAMQEQWRRVLHATCSVVAALRLGAPVVIVVTDVSAAGAGAGAGMGFKGIDWECVPLTGTSDGSTAFAAIRAFMSFAQSQGDPNPTPPLNLITETTQLLNANLRSVYLASCRAGAAGAGAGANIGGCTSLLLSPALAHITPNPHPNPSHATAVASNSHTPLEAMLTACLATLAEGSVRLPRVVRADANTLLQDALG